MARPQRTTDQDGVLRAPRLGKTPRIARSVGAIALLVVGGVHFQQYKFDYFSVIPTIGVLFLANFISATAFGLTLLVPVGPAAGVSRLTIDSVVAVAGSGVAVGAFAALVISEHTPLFGFMEHGYRLEILIALGAEVVTAASLAVFLIYALERLRALRGNGGSGRQAPTAGGPDPLEV
jgi:hypothetical protein